MMRDTAFSKLARNYISEFLFLFFVYLIFDICTLIESLSNISPVKNLITEIKIINYGRGRFNLCKRLIPSHIWKLLKYTSILRYNFSPSAGQFILSKSICMYKWKKKNYCSEELGSVRANWIWRCSFFQYLLWNSKVI